MQAERHILSSHEQLIALFLEVKKAYEHFDGDYAKSRYGAYNMLKDMPEYELAYSPYIEIAKECERSSISLKQSPETGRLYAWNANVAGHGPKLELRAVTLEHVEDKALMKLYHENWAYELGCHIDLDAAYEI
ncbi:hypothetical protein [Psychromonas algicola]|uniref:hypothetical protein n=1 Tax=Psychromonas algicola TaxID=2555642 RepID=UPI001067AB2D|nr:hypothetical protein [Psychromonas sp. RZ5]TEW50159.1 hypothetical protein E2R67_09850 [Psychromonas sp. RZ5]